MNILKLLFGSANDREISRLASRVDRVNELEGEARRLPDAEFPARTASFRERAANGEELDSLLPEAFALCREAAARALGQRHFDVQVMGGLVLHDGKIAEMKTGEGKTLAATLPVYLNSLSGKGVHVVTVNDYLASRDSEWMGQIYRFLGCSCGVIVHSLTDTERREAYACDITYGTNHEMGFDYLRDNMKFTADQFVQRGFNYGIVDEVDSILVDEARTPLIISGPAEQSTSLYTEVNAVIPRLAKDRDYSLDEKARTSILTEQGVGKVEKLLHVGNLYDPENIDVLHHVNQALKAHTLFRRDSEYMVENGKVVIVDEFTGRPMEGRRFSDGLHQALEAKEGVRIENENQTLASITYQNYFRMYDKLAGMTGTADTEAAEFQKIYNLEVVVMPTHRRMIRQDHPDVIYRTQDEKYRAVVEHIAELHAKRQPVLVGTISINNSEKVSRMLTMEGVPHQVLNAKHHEREAQIVARAGQPGAVTISTNMAGRGTDIVLGEGVAENGGLFILGTERHESRRIDNQLRGRSGRQGDPGESTFYLSLEDDLMRIFGGGRLTGIMKTLGMTDGVPISAPIVSRSIENAQKHVESRNFDIRKHLLEYDDVMNRQRIIIYQKRRKILFGEDYMEDLLGLLDEESQAFVIRHMDPAGDDGPNWKVLELECRKLFGFVPDSGDLGGLEGEARYDYLYENGEKALKAHLENIPEEIRHDVVRHYMLRSVDLQWKDHLLSMDHLKSGVSLRGYAQKDPLREYQREGFDMFSELLDRVRTDTLEVIFSLRVRPEAEQPRLLRPSPRVPQRLNFSGGGEVGGFGDSGGGAAVKIRKVGRNEPCPCGSGKKYKHCHGRDE
jgi:preprotein translocase subunit SecA